LISASTFAGCQPRPLEFDRVGQDIQILSATLIRASLTKSGAASGCTARYPSIAVTMTAASADILATDDLPMLAALSHPRCRLLSRLDFARGDHSLDSVGAADNAGIERRIIITMKHPIDAAKLTRNS
jgi:hypothetical protein